MNELNDDLSLASDLQARACSLMLRAALAKQHISEASEHYS